MTAGGTRRRRRDAVENEQRVLAAAVTSMLRDGREVPMSVIAAEAGVGVGTLYRRYPDREALLLALSERAFALLADIAEGVAARDGDGQQLLSRWWDHVIDEHDQLVLPLHGGPTELSAEAVAQRDRLHAALRRILARGRADGTVRPDVTLTEVIQFGAMLASPVAGTTDWRRVARRHKRVHLDGLRPR